MSAADEAFQAKMELLKQQIEHHVTEEENDLFPRVKGELEPAELEALGAKMEEMFEAELEESPADDVPFETEKPAEIRPRRAPGRARAPQR